MHYFRAIPICRMLVTRQGANLGWTWMQQSLLGNQSVSQQPVISTSRSPNAGSLPSPVLSYHPTSISYRPATRTCHWGSLGAWPSQLVLVSRSRPVGNKGSVPVTFSCTLEMHRASNSIIDKRTVLSSRHFWPAIGTRPSTMNSSCMVHLLTTACFFLPTISGLLQASVARKQTRLQTDLSDCQMCQPRFGPHSCIVHTITCIFGEYGPADGGWLAPIAASTETPAPSGCHI